MAYTSLAPSPTGFCLWNISLRYLIVMVAFIFIITPISMHYYLSTLAGVARDGAGDGSEGPLDEDGVELGSHYGGVLSNRHSLDYTQEMSGSRLADLKFQIEELRRIKASVNQELRELEKKRLYLHENVTHYHSDIQDLQGEYKRSKSDLDKLKVSIENTKLEQEEIEKRNMPDIRAPRRILPARVAADNVRTQQGVRAEQQSCSLHNCFDYSRCSLTSQFPVYFYSPEQFTFPHGLKLDMFLKDSVTHSLGLSPHVTFDASIACIFIVLIGDVSVSSGGVLQTSDLERYLQGLPYWQGDGRNHMLLHVSRRLTAGSGSAVYDPFIGVNIGRAMIARSMFSPALSYRPMFDVITPPSLGISHGEVWSDLPMLSPAKRKHLMSFQGEYQPAVNNSVHRNTRQTTADHSHSDRKYQNTMRRLQNVPNYQDSGEQNVYNSVESQHYNSQVQPNRTRESDYHADDQLMLTQEHITVEIAKQMQVEYPRDNFHFEFSCALERVAGLAGEWSMCGPSSERFSLLKDSTFALIIAPVNASRLTGQRFVPTTTLLFQARFYEALKYGAIPVILGGDYNMLPYHDIIDWRPAVLMLPKARITELHFYIRSFNDIDILSLRRAGRTLWQTYMGSTKTMVDALLTSVRTRLQIPAFPAREEPSPSVFNDTFRPLVAADLEDLPPETDDVLGPVESPFPSLSYRHNFSFMAWGVLGAPDPHRLYPFTPYEDVLPGEAKFLGSSTGFRPINHGAGGAGKEFGEALGGNIPREQFTIVMLTYEREAVLIDSLQRLRGLPHLNKAVVVWNSPRPPSEDLRWPDIGVPIHVIKAARNSLNNRFLPYDAIETEAILSIDDDAHLRHDEIMFAFRIWRENRDRIVGFPGRFHGWDVEHSGWHYNSNYSCELSMVLTGAAFFHKYYTYIYSNVMPQSIRDKVDELLNCEDLAMNFLVSHLTRKPPVKVTSRWTFRCPGCATSLFQSDSHFQERHHCINYFTKVYGYMPLLNTQGRVDSVLFKTRIPHDKQKCFKFI